MPVEIIDCVQGTPEWHAARMTIPTASEFATVLASGKGGGPSLTRADYMMKLAGEIIWGKPREEYRNNAMDRGNAMESTLRNRYDEENALAGGDKVVQVGFLRNGRKGASPDGLVGASGIVEIKSQVPHLLIKRMLSGEVPPEHMAQCQGNLLVAEREWIDIVVGYEHDPSVPAPPMFRRRIMRSGPYIARLELAISVFNEELDALVAKVRAL